MADKVDWCDANVRHFIDICKGEIEAGNRPLGLFTRTARKNLVTKYEEKTRLKQTKKQLKNKLDNMKKEYTWFMELKNSAIGLGWNEAKQTVDCSNEWWDEHLARCNNPDKGIKSNHVKFRKQEPKHLDMLGVTNTYSSPSPDHDVIVVDPENKCKHRLSLYVRYNWTFYNPGRRYACCCKERNRCLQNQGIKCASFRWVDPKWDARTKGILVKLMKRKEKAEEEARSWEEAWRIAKKEANDTTYELRLMKRYFGEATNSLMNMRKKMRNNALLKKMKNPYSNYDARKWKEEYTKASMELEETAVELQKVKGHLEQATNVVKRVKQSMLEAKNRRKINQQQLKA